MIARYRVIRTTTTESVGWQEPQYRMELVPFVAEFDGEENDPIDELIYDVEASAIPQDFEGPSTTKDGGFEISANEKIEVGTIVDIEIRAVTQVSP